MTVDPAERVNSKLFSQLNIALLYNSAFEFKGVLHCYSLTMGPNWLAVNKVIIIIYYYLMSHWYLS